MFVEKIDSQIAKLIKKEERRQAETLNLIASENYPSRAVREALGSIFVARYAEGRPYKRYYAGQEFIDKLETLVEERVRKIFGLNSKKWAVNVQPYSGSPANYAVLRALLKPGEKILSLALPHGGHLSHGSPVSLSGKDFKIINYFLDKNGFLNYKEIGKLAEKEKPKLIIAGYSAYPRKVDFKKFKKIAFGVEAYLLADIAHIAGLIAAKIHPSPFPWADVVTTTTHKTLRGPRGAIIICKKALENKIFPKVFPGLQGGPHEHTICALGVALKEAMSPKFKRYARQIVRNAKTLANELKKYNFILISGGTDNHLVLVDLRNKGLGGKEAQKFLEKAGIVVNKNTIPYDPRPPYDPSGIRLGTPALTSRGMKEKEMKKITFWINEVVSNPKSVQKIRKEVKKFCLKFPIP
ncbi:MAG: serine hydroxymethyltransferase [Parcubacteria group bacterium CG2_30_36_18]|uniref:Serine hydroxymethyltransferase n=2 Tax=Candidatus Nealsoniibacteriota TaxID=1817911 RepID=A0A2M8DLM1_9BACT|nr:MAG: serine hydroxymethyltransferase [Parcubacteria group bacterium CG2_30_36_18]PIX88121.1 MAG: serine hydroxymethyltransferase [Candidatus Nealsonbacteria bacterium CG_4_10_14_3_um_filter_36_16]PJB98727.1 MAG: serine hydroxymethyltransferase [Candidatus Nealsonbacteria bacterium CG_4_9_14_0_8_um_filter_36_17]